MHVLLTTCTAEKDPARGPLPAVRRYTHPRIHAAAALAQQRDQPLFIFSGHLGLLPAQAPIPWYDHALQPHEVPSAIEALARALQTHGIRRVTALLEPRARPGWPPYCDAVAGGCAAAGVPLGVELWSPSTPRRSS